eukprot:182496-Rhodomonas_salina.2
MASTHNHKAGGYRQRMRGTGGLGRCKETTSGMLERGPAVERRVGPDLLQHVPELPLGVQGGSQGVAPDPLRLLDLGLHPCGCFLSHADAGLRTGRSCHECLELLCSVLVH